MRLTVARSVALSVALWGFCSSGAAHGADDPLAEHPVNEFRIGATTYWLNYTEAVPAGQESQESGVLPGGHVSFTHASRILPVALTATIEILYFDTNYQATLADGSELDQSTSNTFFDAQAVVGYNLTHALLENTRLYAFVGFGYESWKRRIAGPTPYSRLYRWFPIPMGVRVDAQVAYGLRIGASAAFQLLYAGVIDYNLSEANPAVRDLKGGDMGFGVGFEGTLFLTWYFTRYVGISLEPFYEFGHFAESDGFEVPDGQPAIVPDFDPESNIHRVGGRLSIAVQF